MNNKIFEWTGVTTAILYSLFVALNIGIEFIGFSLLLLSAALIGIWAYRGKHKGILLLQFFYASAGVIGMIRWFWLKNEKTFRDLGSGMYTALIIIGLAMFIFIIVFSLKRAKEKRKAQQEEHEKIKEYGESINEETRNKDKWKKKNYGFRLGFNLENTSSSCFINYSQRNW